MAYEYLTGEIETQSAVLQAALHDATLKSGAFAPACLPQLVATATTGATPVGIAFATVPTAHPRQSAPQTFTVSHASQFPFPRTCPIITDSADNTKLATESEGSGLLCPLDDGIIKVSDTDT
jgi:hypothetical protein